MKIRLFLSVLCGAFAMTFVILPVTEGQRTIHLNRLVDVLSQGKVAIGISSGRASDLAGFHEAGKTRAGVTNSDFLFMSMADPSTFSVPKLKAYMQGLVEGGARNNPSSHPMLLRVPTVHEDTRAAQRRIQRVLDNGVYNLMFPHVESAEEALFAIRAMRYPTQDLIDGTRRPNTGGNAPLVWGISESEYRKKADIWPLDPDGELATVILLESVPAVEEHGRAITAVQGATIVIPAPGDLRAAYTANMFPEVVVGGGEGEGLSEDQEEALQAKLEEVFAAQLANCIELDVVCGITAGEGDIERRITQGFRFIIANSIEALDIGHAAAGND